MGTLSSRAIHVKNEPERLTGRRFGKWAVLGSAAPKLYRAPSGKTQRIRYWVCQCDCGAVKDVCEYDLKRGRSTSCGCANNITHGMTKSPEYYAWNGMRHRCNDPKTSGYKNYGGRGIAVCKRWEDSFAAFYADVGPRPSPLHSVERIDNDGSYEPGNVRWATRAEQNRNTRTARILEHAGTALPLSEWARRLGIVNATLLSRLDSGWTLEEALSTPKLLCGRRCRNVKRVAREKSRPPIQPLRGSKRCLDLTWRKFGRLTAIVCVGQIKGQAQWKCRCKCGGEKIASAASLQAERTRSCGCLVREFASTVNKKHGLSSTPEWVAWSSMKGRCNNPRNYKYAIYGGRGIKVCERWMESFKNFYADMGPRPSSAHSLDRINVDGDYRPENCRWATHTTQSRNRRCMRATSGVA